MNYNVIKLLFVIAVKSGYDPVGYKKIHESSGSGLQFQSGLPKSVIRNRKNWI